MYRELIFILELLCVILVIFVLNLYLFFIQYICYHGVLFIDTLFQSMFCIMCSEVCLFSAMFFSDEMAIKITAFLVFFFRRTSSDFLRTVLDRHAPILC